MILVTLGTQDKKFKRLLDMVQNLLDENVIKEKVIVQAGSTKYHSDKMEVFDLIAKDEFDKLLKECDILITHGGIGTILTAIKLGKKVIAIPRLKKYKEHVNDHQLEIVSKYKEEGYILVCLEEDSLKDILEEAKTFKPRKYISNQKNFLKKLEKYLEEN